MRNVFLYGTLRHLPLLEVVIGRDVAPVAAELHDHVVARAEGRDFPILIARSGARAAGIVLEADEAEIARLDHYEGPFGYRLREVTVDSAAGPVAAWAYFPDLGVLQPAEDWDLAAWQAKWGTIVTRSAHEVMATFGTHWAEAVDARHGMILSRAQAFENTAKWQRPRSVGRAMGRDSVRLTGQRHEHLGFFTLDSLTMEHPRFDGGPPMEVTRAVFRAGEAVTLLPYDPVRDRVLLLEQFRAAPFAQGDPEPWLWSRSRASSMRAKASRPAPIARRRRRPGSRSTVCSSSRATTRRPGPRLRCCIPMPGSRICRMIWPAQAV